MAIKYTALTYKQNDLKSTINSQNEILGKLNASDAEEIYKFVSSAPIGYQRFIAQLSVFESFGYFFSNEYYSYVSQEITNKINAWLNDTTVNAFIGINVFNALKSNCLRLDNNIIIDICVSTLKPKSKRFWDDALSLVAKVGLEKVDTIHTKLIVDLIIKTLKDPETRNKLNNLGNCLISVRKTAQSLTTMIDDAVKEFWPDFYKGTYSLEIFSDKEKTGNKYIIKYLNVIDSQNATQGKNGNFSFYGISPYHVIGNIIKSDASTIDSKLLNEIVASLKDTIFSSTQTPRAKMEAYQLATLIGIVLPNSYFFVKQLDGYLQQATSSTLSENGVLLDKVTRLNVQWSYTIFLLAIGSSTQNQIFQVCSLLDKASDAEKIEALHQLSEFLEYANVLDFNNNLLYPFLSLCLLNCTNKDLTIRYYSIKALIHMFTPNTSPIISQQLLSSMNFESANIKCLILRNIDLLTAIDPELAKGLMQKAKCDTHYVVRKNYEELYG